MYIATDRKYVGRRIEDETWTWDKMTDSSQFWWCGSYQRVFSTISFSPHCLVLASSLFHPLFHSMLSWLVVWRIESLAIKGLKTQVHRKKMWRSQKTTGYSPFMRYQTGRSENPGARIEVHNWYYGESETTNTSKRAIGQSQILFKNHLQQLYKYTMRLSTYGLTSSARSYSSHCQYLSSAKSCHDMAQQAQQT